MLFVVFDLVSLTLIFLISLFFFSGQVLIASISGRAFLLPTSYSTK